MANIPKHFAKDAPLEEEKLSLQEEVEHLKIDINKYKELVATFVLKKDDLEYCQKQIDDLGVEFTRKLELLQTVETRLIQAMTSEREVSSACSAQQITLDILKSDNDDLVDKKEIVMSEITELQKEKDRLSSITEEIVKKQDILDILSSDIEKKQEELKKSCDQLIEITRQSDEMQEILSQNTEIHKQKISEIEDREGDISLKETWLKDKEDKLKLLKSELEQYYNRKFPHIII